ASLTPARPPAAAPDVLPCYTIIGPLFGEPEVARQFVRNMLALDYPTDRLQILLALEADDPATREALRGVRLPDHIQVMIVPPVTPGGAPKTKPRACNHALHGAT